ncbi:hypothetical protein WH47_12497 [Habropoda laboriosa]|uniref:Uncharacterized protein n=1 Tax=Habropoda laboriosa TaxID=597456 RepID=A0A0L7R014_9HYME|nr:hypothetical protein WH47_12497 [Habropoda laboriosa]
MRVAGAATYAEGVALVLSELSLTRALARVAQTREQHSCRFSQPRESERVTEKKRQSGWENAR